MRNTKNNANETPKKTEEVMNGHLTKTYLDCPACGSHKMTSTSVAFVAKCEECGAIFGDTDINSASRIVKTSWTERENVPAEETRYFDLTVEDWGGRKERRHGWFDTVTKGVVQVG